MQNASGNGEKGEALVLNWIIFVVVETRFLEGIFTGATKGKEKENVKGGGREMKT